MQKCSTEELINSILRNSFQQNIYLDRTQLNRIAYRVVEEIYNQTGTRIIAEDFITGSQGPILSSVHAFYLQIHDGRTVQEYMKGISERAFFINDEEIEKIVLQVWNKTKSASLCEMLNSVPTYSNTILNKFEKQSALAGW